MSSAKLGDVSLWKELETHVVSLPFSSRGALMVALPYLMGPTKPSMLCGTSPRTAFPRAAPDSEMPAAKRADRLPLMVKECGIGTVEY